MCEFCEKYDASIWWHLLIVIGAYALTVLLFIGYVRDILRGEVQWRQ